jgi:hypothetical protein
MGIRPADFFVLRSPLLSYDELAAWSADLEAPGALDYPERLAAALVGRPGPAAGPPGRDRRAAGGPGRPVRRLA